MNTHLAAIAITIQGENSTDIASFYKEVNMVFMPDESCKIGLSLDAFNDLLHGGLVSCMVMLLYGLYGRTWKEASWL